VLDIIYQKVRGDKNPQGSLLNEHAFKDFMGFFCLTMFKVTGYSKVISHRNSHRKSQTKSQKGGGFKSHMMVISFLLSGFVFYNSYRDFNEALVIPEELMGHIEQFHPGSEKMVRKFGQEFLAKHKTRESKFNIFTRIMHYFNPGVQVLKMLEEFITTTLSEIVDKTFRESLFDATYNSGKFCYGDFELIFTRENFRVLIDNVAVLKQPGLEEMYGERFRPTLHGYSHKVPASIVNKARNLQSNFEYEFEETYNKKTPDGIIKAKRFKKYEGPLDLVLETFDSTLFKRQPCIVRGIYQKESFARDKRTREAEEIKKRVENWVDNVRSMSASVRTWFSTMLLVGAIMIYSIGQKVNEEVIEGEEFNADANADSPKMSTLVQNSISRAGNRSKKFSVKAGKALSRLGKSALSEIKGTVFDVKYRAKSLKSKVKDLRASHVSPEMQEFKESVNMVPNMEPNMGPNMEPRTEIRKNRYGSRILYEQGDTLELLVKDIEDGTVECTYLTRVGPDRADRTRILFTKKGDRLESGKYVSLSLDGMVSLTKNGIRYEENNVRYLIVKGKQKMDDFYQAEPPSSSSAHPFSSDLQKAYKWRESHGLNRFDDGSRQVKQLRQVRPVNLLHETYHLVDPNILRPLERGHPPGYMDAKGELSQEEYIEQMEASGWVYKPHARHLEMNPFFKAPTLSSAFDPMQRQREIWSEQDAAKASIIRDAEARKIQLEKEEQGRYQNSLRGNALFSRLSAYAAQDAAPTFSSWR
jgi:hypothetical protein